MDPVARHETAGVERRQLRVRGVVQGVGFRPLVFRLAVESGLSGHVCNRLGEVIIEVEGGPRQVAAFRNALLTRTVPPARIEQVQEEDLPPAGDCSGFAIIPSGATGASAPVLPPDLAVCAACRSDIADPESRYAGYPFTSCVDCGPRCAAVQSLPYDRPNTSMAPFTLCDACRSEYIDPLCRRFHAQTIACPRCGPQVELWARDRPDPTPARDWRALTQQALQAGQIAAVKGLGGFHLICDGAQQESIERLRERKRRPRKPFALMVRDLDTAARHFDLSTAERELLQSPRAPILLASPRPALRRLLPLESLAPGFHRLGLVLAYTPLHLLLFSDRLRFLVVTSGNASGLPIARTNAEALQQLDRVADLFLLHDREIVLRVEDSVCQVTGPSVSLLRRSRGYVPEALTVPLPATAGGELPVVLAVGAEQKNTFCLVRGGQAVLGPYLGDIGNAEQLAAWWEGLRHLTALFRAEPQLIAFDPHPGYLLSQEATRAFGDRELIPVYHHHAHLAACMAEHGLTGPVIGCILDGTGFGRDGTLWGFEILTGDYVDFERVAHLRPITLPGGEAAIRQPWLMAAALIHDLTGEAGQTGEWVRRLFPQNQADLPLVLAQLDGRISAPRASSAGRLFDAVAAIIGLCTRSSYDGEAATLLGEQAERDPDLADAEWAYPVACEAGEFQTAPLIRHLLDDIERALPIPVIARKFHHSVAEMVCRGAQRARALTGLTAIVLGGGVWQNRYLLATAGRLLSEQGFQLHTPQRVPAGDGGIALGQAVAALWRWNRDVSGRSGPSA